MLGKFMINDEKTEVLLVGTRPYLAKVSLDKIKVGPAVIPAVHGVRYMVVWLDSSFTMRSHVKKTF